MNVLSPKQSPEAGVERTSASARMRLDDFEKTIWLTRPDLRELCEGDQERFEWWLLLNGTREYRKTGELVITGASYPRRCRASVDTTPTRKRVKTMQF
jgi:hypothetical protein